MFHDFYQGGLFISIINELVLVLVHLLGAATGIMAASPVLARRPQLDRVGGCRAGKHRVKGATVEESLFGLRRVHGVHVLCSLQHRVTDLSGGPGLEPVDPAVADTVAELLLLAPQHLVRQIACK